MSEEKSKNTSADTPQNDDKVEDAMSPSASPRDKKTRWTEGSQIPGSSSRQLFTARDLLVSASPPKFINMEDVMKLSNGVTDMALAHEIAVGDNFRLEAVKPDTNSLEGRIKEVMHKAFWDVLAESLKEDPPDYSHALLVIREVKESLMSLLLPQHGRLRVNIDEVLDLALIEQQADHGCLDFRSYADFVIDKMAMLCAPVRDEQISALRSVNDVVALYREILSMLGLMKMDMVNFTIAHFRPYVQQHSVEYERKKFKDLLEVQKGNGIDGLQFTRAWLARHVGKTSVDASRTAPSAVASVVSSLTDGATCGDVSGSMTSQTGATTASEVASSSSVNVVLNDSFLETLDWNDEHQVFPETLLIDGQRFLELRDRISWLTLVSSVVIVTYSTVGASITGLADLKSKLTQQIGVLLKDSLRSQLPETMVGVAEHVNKEVNECLVERGFTKMRDDQQQLLKGQIAAIAEPDNSIYRLMKSRLMTFIERILADPKAKDVQLPPGFSAVSDEVSGVVAQFLRLVRYNCAVFGSYYSEIVSETLKSTRVQTRSDL